MRVRQASSSAGLSSSNSENEAAPPKRPENGPPAQMRGGVKVNAPRSVSM